MESMKSSPSRVCERGDGEPRAVSAQRSMQQAGSNAGSGLCSGGYGGRQGSGAEHSARRGARYTKLSNADGTAHCGREYNIIGSRHFQSLEEQSLRLFVCIWNLPCPVAALGIGLANDCCIMSVMTIANDLRSMSVKFFGK